MADWQSPVPWDISYPYGVKNSRYESGYHTGIDFGVPKGTRVEAVQKGEVILARPASYGSPYGNYVMVRHPNGMISLYAHLSNFRVKVGDHLRAGEQLGVVGHSGVDSGFDHLHFEIRRNESYGSDINPKQFIGPNGYNDNNAGRANGKKNDHDGGDGQKPNHSTYGFNREFLKAHPEIRKLVEQAQKHDWSDQKFQQEIKDTKWWEKTTQAQRQWQILSTEQPAEARDQVQNRMKDLLATASQMGVDLDRKEAKDFAEKALRNGMSDQEILTFLSRQFDMTGRNKGDVLSGTAGTTVEDIRELAYSYGLPVNRKRLERQTRRILAGEMDLEGLRDYYVEQAKALYPGISKQLDRGRTVDDMMSPYLAMAQDQLGVSEDAIKLTDPLWTRALNKGENGMMTMDEWLEEIRSNQKFGYDNTDNARAEAFALAEGIKQGLGRSA